MFLKILLEPFLKCAEGIYRFGLKMHRGLYGFGIKQPKQVNAKVISVGNITWGGTGKTPLVMMIAQTLKDLGKKVVVLTRGYGDDEHKELQDHLEGVTVLVGKNRAKNADIAVQKHQAEYIIMDDGFQHWALKRDADIVTINATTPFGSGRLIPVGSLREPLHYLSRADCFVLTQSFIGRHNIAGLKQRLRELNPDAPVFEADHQPVRFLDFRKMRTLPLPMVRGQRVAVLSGIEDPTSFENTISRLGARVVWAGRFPDHHQFKKKELDEVFQACREFRARYLITTAKDSYRLRRVLNPVNRQPTRILLLQIELRMDDEEGFIKKCLDTSFH